MEYKENYRAEVRDANSEQVAQEQQHSSAIAGIELPSELFQESAAEPRDSTLRVNTKEIHVDPKFLSREVLVEEQVNELAALIKEGVVLPPLRVFESKESPQRYILLSGLQTFHATKQAELDEVAIEISTKETDLERFVEAVEPNSRHGLPLTSREKSLAVERLLDFEETHCWPSGKIARIVGCSDRTVDKIRAKHPSSKNSKIRNVSRGGTEYPQKTRSSPVETPAVESLHVEANKTAAKENEQLVNPTPPEETDKNKEQKTHNDNIRQPENGQIFSEGEKFEFTASLQALRSVCERYSNMYDRINDRDDIVTSLFLDNLDLLLEDLQEKLDSLKKIIGAHRGRA